MASVERIVRAPPDEHEVFRARIELKKVMPVVYFLVAPPSKRERWAIPKWEETLPKALVVEALCGAHREAPSPKALFLMLFSRLSALTENPPPDVVYRASKWWWHHRNVQSTPTTKLHLSRQAHPGILHRKLMASGERNLNCAIAAADAKKARQAAVMAAQAQAQAAVALDPGLAALLAEVDSDDDEDLGYAKPVAPEDVWVDPRGRASAVKARSAIKAGARTNKRC
jgi:hypothetical protein